MKFIQAILALKELFTGIRDLWSQFSRWRKDRAIEKNIEKLKEGINENDTTKIENAINSDLAGKPSGLPGVRQRDRGEG